MRVGFRRVFSSRPIPSVVLPVTALTAPALASGATEGQSLSAIAGTYSGTAPISFARQWQISDDGVGGWSNTSGETSLTRSALTALEAGKYVRMSEIASNVLGAIAAQYTAAAFVAAASPPGSGTATVAWDAQAGTMEIAWGPEAWSASDSQVVDATLGTVTITGLESGTLYFMARSLPDGEWYSLGTKVIA